MSKKQIHRPSVPDDVWRRLQAAGAAHGMDAGQYLLHLAERECPPLKKGKAS